MKDEAGGLARSIHRCKATSQPGASARRRAALLNLKPTFLRGLRSVICLCATVAMAASPGTSGLSRAGTLSLTYDAAGRLTAARYDNSATQTFQYDHDGGLLSASVLSSPTGDIAVGQSLLPAQPVAGVPFQILITVGNLTETEATSVGVTGELSQGLEFIAATASRGTCDATGRALACDIGDMAGGTDESIVATVLASAAGGCSFTSEAGSTNDSNATNNRAETVFPSLSPPTLELRANVPGEVSEIAWPAMIDGLRLEETPSLDPPVVWTPSGTPSLSGNILRVPVPLDAENRFFRLGPPR